MPSNHPIGVRQVSFYIDEVLWEGIKIRCIRNRITMRSWLEAAVRDRLKEDPIKKLNGSYDFGGVYASHDDLKLEAIIAENDKAHE